MVKENTKKQLVLHADEAGNAFVYILIAVILFGGLSFMMSRSNTNTAAKSELDDAQLSFRVEEIIKYTTEVQSVITRMETSGTHTDDLDFILPAAANFNTAPNYNKVYHSAGGGLYEKNLNSNIVGSSVTIPNPGWYLGRFNNVEWTPTTSQDVILTAHNITSELCAALNKKLIGDETIPAISFDPSEVLIDASFGGASNDDFTVSDCAACEGKTMLCIEGMPPGATVYNFYAIVSPQ